MARTNKKPVPVKTHEGGTAKRITKEQELARSVLSCMLWEDAFYEDGVEITERIKQLVPLVGPYFVQGLAIKARNQMKLRHVPLFITREMCRHVTHKSLVAETLREIIQRPDELTEFLSLYWKDGKTPIAAQVKKGLADAFTKFDSYALAKYNRDNQIKLRDVLFLCHAKPKDKSQAEVWKKLVDGTLESPDTWEVRLSGGEDKKKTFTDMIQNKKLGALAMLRNLRNAQESGVEDKVIIQGLQQMNPERVLPFRFISAAKYAPRFEPYLEEGMFKCLANQAKMLGHAVLLLDVSGSMDSPISAKSEVSRLQTACGLAMLLREICEQVSIFTFSDSLVEIPPRRGFALAEVIQRSQHHSGTPLGAAVKSIYAEKGVNILQRCGYNRPSSGYVGQGLSPDRLIVITDEQSNDQVPDPKGKGYMINVAPYKTGVGYGPWIHVDGWSEAIIDYIQELENFSM
jgi:hypothetical protein